MPKFASGRWAYGISDRSGQRYRLRDMRKEWNGLLVGKDEWEPKHPQLGPAALADNEALRAHSQGFAHEPFHINAAAPLQVWLSGFERDHVGMGDLQFGHIFNGEDALLMIREAGGTFGTLDGKQPTMARDIICGNEIGEQALRAALKAA